MSFEKSAGAVIFRKRDSKIEYLLLHYPSSAKTRKAYFDFPKGHVEEGETIEDTVKREIKEETGISDLKFLVGFKENIRYFFKFNNKNIFKIVTFFLAETKTDDVKISSEHLGFKWLPYEKALKQVTFKNAKTILNKAEKFIKDYGSKTRVQGKIV